jgi:hypothetical protein
MHTCHNRFIHFYAEVVLFSVLKNKFSGNICKRSTGFVVYECNRPMRVQHSRALTNHKLHSYTTNPCALFFTNINFWSFCSGIVVRKYDDGLPLYVGILVGIIPVSFVHTWTAGVHHCTTDHYQECSLLETFLIILAIVPSVPEFGICW